MRNDSQNWSHQTITRQKKITLLVVLLLLILLPVLLLAVKTVQDIRNRAQGPAQQTARLCYNKVNVADGKLVWPCPCCKEPNADPISCAQVITPLTPPELDEYNNVWIKGGCVLPNGCGDLKEGFKCISLIQPVPSCQGQTDGTLCQIPITCIKAPCDPLLGICQGGQCMIEIGPTVTGTPIPTPTKGPSHKLKFKVKLTGIDTGAADGTAMSIRVLNSNLDLIVSPVPTLSHTGSGVYEANFTLSESELPIGSGYRILVKAGKHLGRKFCKISGQNAPCSLADTITINYAQDPLVFDFTGLPLDPGDVPPQNGVVNQEDFNRIITQMNQPCGTQTNDYRAADLNYSGCVNVIDAGLMRNTLQTRYDDN